MKRNSHLLLAGSVLLLPLSALHAEEVEGTLDELILKVPEHTVLPAHFAGNSTVISEGTIADAGARSLAELLASQGGVRFSSATGNPAGGEIHLRGFGENAASRVLILVDGRRQNRPDMASVSWLSVPLGSIERIEILRGSQTARFGDNAVGGVINIVTKKGGPKSTTIELAGGSDGYSLLRLNHRDSLGDHSLSFDLERNFTDGWRDNAMSEVESATLRLGKTLSPEAQWNLGLSWADELTGFPGPLSYQRYRDNPRQSIYKQAGQANEYFSAQTSWAGDTSISYDSGGDWKWEIPVSFTRRDLAWNFGPGYHSDNEIDTLLISPTWTYQRGRWSVEFGLPYRSEALDLAQFAEISRINQTTAADLQRKALGVYAVARWEAWTNWHLEVSGRAERTELTASVRSLVAPTNPALNFSRESNATHTAWQTGIRWEPNATTAAWWRYDRLYRLPSTDEIASYQGFPLSVPFNDQLKAEVGHNLELGAEWNPKNWTLRLNAFAQQLKGEITYDYLQNLNTNLADTRRLGLEMSAGYRRDSWDANLHATVLRAEYDSGTFSGNQLYLVPQHELTATFAYRPTDWLSLQAEHQYVGAAYEGNDFANNQAKLPSYGVTHLMIRYQPKPALSLYLRVNNLFNERYATVKYSGVWYPAAGRQFQFGLRHEF